ncbi:hypothetical protein ACFU7T_25280 [Streptomyces sp. NPDC057555]|uniref:hypothetical protein n=1 Tax=Streptomyces sp. NPDC057555 TaxID=3346166 RepID=UPI003678A64F
MSRLSRSACAPTPYGSTRRRSRPASAMSAPAGSALTSLVWGLAGWGGVCALGGAGLAVAVVVWARRTRATRTPGLSGPLT